MSIYFIGNKELVENEHYKTSTVKECIEYLNKLDEIGLDFETTGFCPHQNELLSLQLGNYERQYVIDTNVIDIRVFKDLIENKKILGQNLKFDTRFLYKKGIWPKDVYDTFLAELVLNTGRENVGLSLKALCERYCNIDLDKSVRGNIQYEGLSTRVIIYAANDVKYLHEIKEKQEIRLQEQDLMRVLELENKHILALAYTEYCGFKLNVNQWIKNAKANREKLKNQAVLLTNWVIDNNMHKYIDNQLDLFSDEKKVNIEWSSSKQVIKFFKDLGIDTLARDKKTGEMKDSVEASHISKFKKESTFIPIYLEYKEMEKQVSTYGEGFLKYLNPITKRLHSEFYPILDTGRISSNNPNLQNITADPDVRKCFVGEEGNTLIVSDYSAQEPRVLAALSNDSKLIDFFANGDGDIHSLVASNMYTAMEGKPVKVTKADYERRQIGKIMGLKLNYGGSAFTVKDDLGVPIEEAEKFVKAFIDAFPEKEEYYKQGIAEAKRVGHILTNNITRRKIFPSFYDRWLELRNKPFNDRTKEEIREFAKINGRLERMVKNYRIQGTAADQTKLACVYIFRNIRTKYPEVKIVAVVHDEIILESPKEIAEEVKYDLQEAMERAANLVANNPNIVFLAEPKITPIWEK